MSTRENPTTADGRSLFHDITRLFPPMTEQEYAGLRADIQRQGLLTPLWRYQGQIIDGRQRYRACQELGIEPTYREWDGQGSLVRFVVGQNMTRQHFSENERAMIMAAVEQYKASESEAATGEEKE